MLEAPRLASQLGVEEAGGGLYVKDEGRLPTGSFKVDTHRALFNTVQFPFD